ncbi:hypothetical protein [Anaerotignum sp.]|uniref:hypothetical protein n=1 Tax=Anaerotignum sp. TaxID=2039241 RepID=UPI0028AB0795|nr:hypothetical protein [Anaerotignum sp.]
MDKNNIFDYIKYNTDDSFNNLYMLYNEQMEIVRTFQDIYLKHKKISALQGHFETSNTLPAHTFNLSTISSIKYWYTLLWHFLITANTDKSYAKHKETRTALIILIKHYNFLFKLGSTETKHDTASPTELESNMLSIYKTLSSASINFPLFKCLSFSIIQSKRKLEAENREMDALDLIHDTSLFNDSSLDSLWESSVNILLSFNANLKDCNPLKEKLNKNMRPKFYSLISLIIKYQIPTIFLPYMITAFMLNYKTEWNDDKDFSIIHSILSFKSFRLKDIDFNVLTFMNSISDSIFTALTKISHNTMPPPWPKTNPNELLKQFVSFNKFTRLEPYLEFPIVNFDKIKNTLFQNQELAQKQDVVCACLNHAFTYWGHSNKDLSKFSNALSAYQRKLIKELGFLCSFATYSTFNTRSNAPEQALSSLKVISSALANRTLSYDDFKEIFFVGKTRNINELLLYDQLRIPLKKRTLNKLLMELYDIDFRESCIDIRNMVVEEFSSHDYFVKDTSYILIKTKFINKLVAKFKSNDCKRFLDNIEHFEQEPFEAFLTGFCNENNIPFPNFNTFDHPSNCNSLKDAFLTDAFSAVLDLSIIELEQQFNLFWQYDFSIGYKEKKDIRPTYVLSRLNRTTINAFTK